MSDILVVLDRVSKKFCRSLQSSLRYSLQDTLRRAFRRPRREALRRDEFWALDEVSLSVSRGECLGLIGPNGAGKSTLLKLVNRDYRPDRGTVITRGGIKSLIRLGSGLQPMLTGRENIYIQCSELGLGKRETDVKLDDIVAFAELQKSLDAPVKHYSDGMYARLEFAVATSVPMDILLIDEVLAVGDIAFQLRCLERLHALKRQGAALLFVSHSEMNIRQVADRCLLLFDGKSLTQGHPDAVLCKYYDAVGYLNPQLKPLKLPPEMPADCAQGAAITALQLGGEASAKPGQPLAWIVEYQLTVMDHPAPALVLQFWNSAGILIGAVDSRLAGCDLPLRPGGGEIALRLPFLPLAPGLYRIAGGFMNGDRFIGYSRELATLRVWHPDYHCYGGFAVVPAEFSLP